MEENSEKCQYLAGYLDFGVFGKKEVYLVRSKGKEGNTPALKAVARLDGEWKEVGAFWDKQSKDASENVEGS